MPTLSVMARYDIDLRSKVPSYQQLADLLRADLTSGRILPDDPLPSIARLVQETGLDPKTVRHAISLLTTEGLVYTVPGRGTYAAPPP